MIDRKRWIWIVAALLISLTLAAGVFEAWLEISAARRLYQKSRERFHPFLQLVPSEYLEGVNAERFRGEAVTLQKPANTLRIFTLGGSTTLGVLNPYADTYPRLLQVRLQQQYPGLRIEVQNAGVDWYTTAHSLVNYVLRVRRFNPDLVIIMHGINDVYRSFAPPWLATGPFKEDYSHYLGPGINFVGPRTGLDQDYNLGFWMMWRLLSHAVRRDPWPLDQSAESLARLRGRLREVPVSNFKSLNSFKENYDLLVRTIQADGRAVMAASEPFLYREDLSPQEQRVLWFAPVLCVDGGQYPTMDSMRSGMVQFNEAARAIAAARNVPFMDFEGAVPKDLKHFTDDVHLTRAGNEILAGMAALSIVNHPIPPLPDPPGKPADTRQRPVNVP